MTSKFDSRAGMFRTLDVVAAEKDPFGGDPYEKRDPEVERATSGGWSSILPRRTIFTLLGISAVATLTPEGSWLNNALNEPLFRKEEVDQVDAAGTSYGTLEKRVPSGGIALIVLYNVFARVLRPRLEKDAREKQQQAESKSDDE